MRLKVLTQPPNYGRTIVGKTPGQLGRLAGGAPSDRRGVNSIGVRIRKGRSR